MNTTSLACLLVAAVTASARAQDFLDDFNDGSATDGNPVTWVPSPGFDAEFSVVDGDLLVSMDSDTVSSPRVANYFAAGASVRARMVGLNGPGRYTVAFADEPTGIKGYVASFSTCRGGRIELFRGDRPGQITYLGGGPLLWDFSPDGQEFLVQLDVFNGVVSARVWRPGEPFPEPQITADDSFYPDGVPSIAIQDFGGPNESGCGGAGDTTDAAALVRYTHVSSTPLTHSECGDFNADGRINPFDFLSFQSAFGNGHPDADVDGNGTLNVFDFLKFQTIYSEGC